MSPDPRATDPLTPPEWEQRLSSSNDTVYVQWPQGAPIRGRVEEIEPGADSRHRFMPHRWHEMLHDGRPGTGFAMCRCGAVGVPSEPHHHGRYMLFAALAGVVIGWALTMLWIR